MFGWGGPRSVCSGLRDGRLDPHFCLRRGEPEGLAMSGECIESIGRSVRRVSRDCVSRTLEVRLMQETNTDCGAVREMKDVGPSTSAYGGRRQTTLCCVG